MKDLKNLAETRDKGLHCAEDSVTYAPLAQMAELVDALASGASVLTDVEVQVLFWAPWILRNHGDTLSPCSLSA